MEEVSISICEKTSPELENLINQASSSLFPTGVFEDVLLVGDSDLKTACDQANSGVQCSQNLCVTEIAFLRDTDI